MLLIFLTEHIPLLLSTMVEQRSLQPRRRGLNLRLEGDQTFHLLEHCFHQGLSAHALDELVGYEDTGDRPAVPVPLRPHRRWPLPANRRRTENMGVTTSGILIGRGLSSRRIQCAWRQTWLRWNTNRSDRGRPTRLFFARFFHRLRSKGRDMQGNWGHKLWKGGQL